MSGLSITGKQKLAGVVLVQWLFFLLNLQKLHLFGAYDKKVLVISTILMGIYVLFFGPTVEELKEYRSRR